MNESTIKKVIGSMRDLRERAANASRERSVAKIDTFDVRSRLGAQERLIYLAEKQREKEYQSWKLEQGLSDDSRKWEFERDFEKRIMEQSSMNAVPPPKSNDVVAELEPVSKVLGRQAADQRYWSEKSRLEVMISKRKAREKSRALYELGYDMISEIELEGQLHDRALLIAYHEYLLKVKEQKITAFKNLAINVLSKSFCIPSRSASVWDGNDAKLHKIHRKACQYEIEKAEMEFFRYAKKKSLKK